MPLEAPVTRAVPFDVELLISFSPVSSRVSLHFIWIIVIIHSPTLIRIVGLWLQTFFGGSMRHSKAEKAKTHKRVVAIASRRFREEGLAGIGIADLMKEAGLTVGGFYKHFDSRDELVAEALGDAFGVWQRQKEAAASSGQPLSFEKLIDDYVSDVHRRNPGAGCAFSALAPEIARSDKRTRALTTDQVKADLVLLAGLLPGKD